MTEKISPELLAPAGSPDALRAALRAGADAVYLGLDRFNARAGARNFTLETLREAVRLTHLYNKKLYLTLNTLVFDRELDEVLDRVEDCMRAGVDAFIVQDFGLMALLKKTFPEIVIHASTQCATHNLAQIEELAKMGVERAVIAREVSRRDLEIIMKKTPVEIEAFVHGALCMSHSGTCLMSAYMGGRSGNRGECAQPCRLPYRLEKSKNPYPLSLCDLTLAKRVPELISLGVNSFKIEGRMKSPEYVGGVVKIFRRLIDECRGADDEEMRKLENIFSRNGFTEGYYTEKKGKEMFGTRRQEDKEKTRSVEKISLDLEKIPVKARFSLEGSAARLIYFCRGKSGEALCPVLTAEGEGTGEDMIREAVSKLGSTPFYCEKTEVNIPCPVFIKRSSLNEARRAAITELEEKLVLKEKTVTRHTAQKPRESKGDFEGFFLVFREGSGISESELSALLEKEEVLKVFLPFSTKLDCPSKKCGILLPRAVFDRERASFEKRLLNLFEKGYTSVFCENLGVASIAKACGFQLYGGAGLNTANSFTGELLFDFGFQGVVLSHELTPAQKRELIKSGAMGECVWGRAPLMLVENCPIGTRDGCHSSPECSCHKTAFLTDRQNEAFPVLPDYSHRAVIYNSRPTNLADTPVTKGIRFRVVYITQESASKVLSSVLSGEKPSGKFTRK